MSDRVFCCRLYVISPMVGLCLEDTADPSASLNHVRFGCWHVGGISVKSARKKTHDVGLEERTK